MPDDSTFYYGFSRFAMELNEILDAERSVLPITDTRYRPDQRFLEEGQVEKAETMKLRLEQNQRERRQRMEEEGTEHRPRWFQRSSDDKWTFNGDYWKKREHGGFQKLGLPQLW